MYDIDQLEINLCYFHILSFINALYFVVYINCLKLAVTRTMCGVRIIVNIIY